MIVTQSSSWLINLSRIMQSFREEFTVGSFEHSNSVRSKNQFHPSKAYYTSPPSSPQRVVPASPTPVDSYYQSHSGTAAHKHNSNIDAVSSGSESPEAWSTPNRRELLMIQDLRKQVYELIRYKEQSYNLKSQITLLEDRLKLREADHVAKQSKHWS